MANKFALAAAVAMLLVASASAYDDTACKHIVGYQYYDFSELFENTEGHNTDLSIAASDSNTDTLVLNMCNNQTTVDCSGSASFAALETSAGACSTVVTTANVDNYDDDDKELKWKDTSEDDEDDDTTQKVKITYPVGGSCTPTDANDTQSGYKLIVNLTCDRSATDATTSYTLSECDINAYITSKHACPTFNESVIITFIEQYSYVFGGFLCAFGIFLIFKGNEKFAWTIGIIGFLTTVVLVGSLGYQYIINPQPQTAPSTGWIIWGVAALLGIGAGFLLGKAYKGALFLLGAWLGVVLALFLNPIVLYKIQLNPPSLTLYLAMGIFGIALGFVALLAEEHMKIIATSILGAYSLARGLSFFLGGFPPETELADQIEAGDMASIPYTIFLYFTLFSVLSVVGMFVQYRKKEKEEEDENKYKAL